MGAKNGGAKRKKKRKNAGERESRRSELSGELSVRYGTVRYGTVRDGTAVAELPDLIDWPNNNQRSSYCLSLYSQSSPPPLLSPPLQLSWRPLLCWLVSRASIPRIRVCAANYPPTSLTAQISPCCLSTQPPCSRYVLFVWNVDPSSPSRLVHISAVLLPTPSLPC